MLPRVCACFLAVCLPAAAQDSTPGLFRWRATSPLNEPRAGACAVKLSDGRVLVAGGDSGAGPINSAEIYRHGEGFTLTAYLNTPRAGHTCTLLDDGRVLAYGGGEGAEIFDPAASRWDPVPAPGPARRGHTATRTPAGDVIFVGGETATGPSPAIERWNAATAAIELSSATLSQPRKDHAAALLPDGRLLITGGTAAAPLASTEIFDPLTNEVASGPDLPRARAAHSAIALYDDRILLAGGAGNAGELAEAEIYLPAEARFETLPATLRTPRQGHLALLLEDNGAVLFAGGTTAGETTGASELFQPATNQFVDAGALTLGRSALAGAMLDGGLILAVGGTAPSGPVAACGVLTAPTLRLYVAASDGNRAAAFEGETVRAEGANWSPVSKILRLKMQTPAGSEFDESSSLLQSLASFSSFQFDAFRIPARMAHGNRYLLTATDGLQLVTASIDVKQPTRIFVRDNGGAIVGEPLLIGVSIAATLPTTAAPDTRLGGMPISSAIVRGSFVDPNRGRISNQVSFSQDTIPPATQFANTSFLLCCTSAVGTFQTETVSLSSTRNYHSTSVAPFSFRVYDNLPVFTIAGGAFTLGVPKNFRVVMDPPALVPYPPLTGTVSLSRGKNPAETVDVNSYGDGPVMTYTPTVTDIPGLCFTAQYSGNAKWKSLRDTRCLPVNPTPSSVSISTPASTYAWGTPLSLPVILNWTATDARLLNSTATLTANIGSDRAPVGSVSLSRVSSTGAATPAGSSSWVLPMNVRRIDVSYSGSTDIQPATSSLSISMEPIPTATQVSISAINGRDVTLLARVNPAPVTPVSNFSQQPFYAGPAGTMRFFDGTLLLGTVTIGPNTLARPDAVFTAVSLTAGAHTFRAVFEPSSSPVMYRTSEASLDFAVK